MPQQNQKLLKSRLHKVAVTIAPVDAKVPASDDKTESESLKQNFDPTSRSEAGVQIADDEVFFSSARLKYINKSLPC